MMCSWAVLTPQHGTSHGCCKFLIHTKSRLRTALQALQRTAQSAAGEGAQLARAGARAGMAAARGAANHPILATGLTMAAGGAAYSVASVSRNDPASAVAGVQVASAGVTLLLARTMLSLTGDIVRDAANAIEALRQEAEREAAASGRSPIIGAELFNETMNEAMTFGNEPPPAGSLAALVGNRLPQLTDHLLDLRAGSARREVAAVLHAAHGDPGQLIRGLLQLIDNGVLSSRPNSAGMRRDH
ncbi:hypothetical protein [Paracidovorax avenae]|uniref:hypothetical protein n=2 Tax=Paracidovorax avenae TaxID=80867 RepID=UPI00128F8237|nr:hypothetical protein [Paracidovorax avenae]